MSEPPLRVMLVDDHQVVRDGIKLLTLFPYTTLFRSRKSVV